MCKVSNAKQYKKLGITKEKVGKVNLEAGPPEKATRTESVGRTMALLVTASLNFPNSWARKHSPHRPTPPATTTTAPPPHLPQEAAAPDMERRPRIPSGASSTADEVEEEQWARQPAPPQEEDEAAAMLGWTGAQVRGFGSFFFSPLLLVHYVGSILGLVGLNQLVNFFFGE